MTKGPSTCQSCGACCDTSAEWPRFSLETDAEIALIPPRYVAGDGAGMRCLGDRCAALAGAVGKLTACVIYDFRPLVCRDCQPGDDACRQARERHGMPALPAAATSD